MESRRPGLLDVSWTPPHPSALSPLRRPRELEPLSGTSDDRRMRTPATPRELCSRVQAQCAPAGPGRGKERGGVRARSLRLYGMRPPVRFRLRSERVPPSSRNTGRREDQPWSDVTVHHSEDAPGRHSHDRPCSVARVTRPGPFANRSLTLAGWCANAGLFQSGQRP
jgi:hypothetical protein